MNALVTHFGDSMRSQIENGELCDLWLRGLQSFEELDIRQGFDSTPN